MELPLVYGHGLEAHPGHPNGAQLVGDVARGGIVGRVAGAAHAELHRAEPAQIVDDALRVAGGEESLCCLVEGGR